ncbi:UNVERIFIED_CONTAM: hypothetical protein H355_014719, partial [Colinus virginianus]
YFSTECDCCFSIGSVEEKFICGGFPGKVSNPIFKAYMFPLISFSYLVSVVQVLECFFLLFRKPVSSVGFHINNELMEVIPSSNPNSQTDAERHYLLEKVVCKEVSTQEKYLKTDCANELKEQWQVRFLRHILLAYRGDKELNSFCFVPGIKPVCIKICNSYSCQSFGLLLNKSDHSFSSFSSDLHVGDEFVFVDNLKNYRKKLPGLSTLLGRLKFFCVRDPLFDSEGQNLTEENIFRDCLTFQNEIEMLERKKDLQGIKEDFCTTPLKDKEVLQCYLCQIILLVVTLCVLMLVYLLYFMLSYELEFCKSSNSKSDSIKNPSYLELKKLLDLAPETMADENMCEDVIKEDLKGRIVNKMEVSKYCPTSVVRSTNSVSMLEISESANHISYLKAEIEVPLTPLCKQQRPQLNFLCEGLQEELNPLFGNSILITEPSMEYLDSLVWQSEKYWDNVISLLLVEHQRFKLESWRYSLTELKEMLSINVETPMFISLEEDWWLHMGFDLICIDTLEQLKWDSNSTNSLLSTEVETFTPFSTHHLESTYLLKKKKKINKNYLHFSREIKFYFLGWLEEKNSMSDQELLSTEIHQVDEINDLCTSPQTMMQPFGLPINAASSLKIDRTNTSLENVAGGSIQKSNIEKPIYFLSQEEKTDKSLASVICKDVPFKQHNTSEGPKPASFTLDSKWDSGDSDLNDFIMLRCKHTISQRQEKSGVDSPEKVLQPEEQHLPEHRGDSSVCEPVRTEKKEQENDSRFIVNIRASVHETGLYCCVFFYSESQCQAYCLLKGAATSALKDLKRLGVLASVSWSFDNIKFDHTRFFLKQQEKVLCDHFKEGKVDEKETKLFRHAALVHLLVTGRDLLLTCGLDTTLEYLSKAKDIYKNVLESCLNNIWRQLKIVQYSSQKKHESSPKLTELQCRMLNWMHTYADKHSVKTLIITRMESEREKAALIHTVTRIEGLKAIDLNSEKKGNTLSYNDIITKYSLKGDTLLSLVLIYATLIEFTQKSEDFKVKVVLTPGIEETALLIRQIADNMLMTSSLSPHKWLDKSWLSVLPSEVYLILCQTTVFFLFLRLSYSYFNFQMEKYLLTFPCINSLVAQLMLKKESSLNRLFLASFDQLQELLPEVPKKVLKNVDLCYKHCSSAFLWFQHFSDITSSYSRNAAASLKTVKHASSPEYWNTFNRLYPDYKQNCQPLELLPKAQTSTGQAFRTHYISDYSSKNSEKDFFTNFSDCVPHDSSTAFLEGLRDTTFKSSEILIDETPRNDFSSTCTLLHCFHVKEDENHLGDNTRNSRLQQERIGDNNKVISVASYRGEMCPSPHSPSEDLTTELEIFVEAVVESNSMLLLECIPSLPASEY